MLAHRLSIISDADRVIVMKDGEAGFTEAAQTEGARHQVTLVTLAQLDETLQAAAESWHSRRKGSWQSILPCRR